MHHSPILISGPLSLGDIIDRAIRLYRAHFGLLVLTAAVLLVPLGIVDAILTALFAPAGIAPPPGQIEGSILRIVELYAGGLSGSSVFPIPIISFVVSLVVNLVLAFQVISLIHNREAGVGASLRGGLRRFWPYLWNTLLAGIAVASLALVLALPMFCIGPFAFLLAIPGIFYLMARWIVTLPIIIAEECGPVEALKRSWRLTEGMVWRSIGFSLLTGLLGLIITGLPTLTVTTILDLALGANLGALTSGVTNAVGTLAALLWQPIVIAATVLYYFDLRVRQEGYDLSMRVEQVEAGLGAEPIK